MTKLEPGQRGPSTRRRWFFLALAVGGALAVLVVGTLFGVLGDSESGQQPVPPIVHSMPRPTAPVVAAPVVTAPPVVGAPPAPSGDGATQQREITTHGPDGTTTIVVTSDGTVMSTTATRAPN